MRNAKNTNIVICKHHMALHTEQTNSEKKTASRRFQEKWITKAERSEKTFQEYLLFILFMFFSASRSIDEWPIPKNT